MFIAFYNGYSNCVDNKLHMVPTTIHHNAKTLIFYCGIIASLFKNHTCVWLLLLCKGICFCPSALSRKNEDKMYGVGKIESG